MDDLQVDSNTFTRMTCCGKAMHKHCSRNVQKSKMSQALKDRCHECRTVYPTTKEGNVKQARVWVDKGKAWAQTFLANHYKFGEGVPQSYEEAIEYYNMAVKQGDPNAMFELADIYRNGQGVAKSMKKAVELYALAANQGHARAQYNVGVLFDDGNGVAQSNATARKWWLKAALQEHEMAIGNLKFLDQEEGKTTPTLPCCATCGTPKTTRRPLNTCSQCHTTHYCNRECQMKHWKEGGHKRECKQLQQKQEKKMAAAAGLEK
jgi:TPR repeat protein